MNLKQNETIPRTFCLVVKKIDIKNEKSLLYNRYEEHTVSTNKHTKTFLSGGSERKDIVPLTNTKSLAKILKPTANKKRHSN